MKKAASTTKRTTSKKQKTEGLGVIGELDRYLFGEGRHYQLYHKLGAHPYTYRGQDGYYFAVWAPHAAAVSLVGDFNAWNPDATPMKPVADSGIYELFVPGLGVGQLYKFAITTHTGTILFKADPYAFSAEYRPGTASVTADIRGFKWNDSKWMESRAGTDPVKAPISIYEVHLGSWKKKNRPEKDGYYTYMEAAHELADYVLEMGYTHVELMGIAEHPYDGSWGYQVTGYFAPTSRYGTPTEFMYFVNYLHKKGIGVILDWVPAHFPKDAHGLADFDGQALYEYADPRKGEHPDWGTKVFDYAKNEVSNFLIANALYWLDEYHIDGLRVDAVASMLYLDYGRQDGQWVPNKYGDNKNLEAIEFFKHLNSVIRGRKDGAIIIAEESTAWPNVTKSPEEDGLGFTFKWNMGWMHDFLEYMKLDPYFRKFNHNKMTFGITYCTSENFILVLSHDEVVHLKCSMINKMPGEYEDKFANLKVGYTFMLGHPGKKLLFMGQDFGQFHEWDEKVSLDWYLTKEPFHADLQNYVKGLLTLYHKYPALYRLDEEYDGFQWINANDGDRSIFSFIRRDETQKKNLLFICNFTPVDRDDYRVGVPKRGTYTLLLDQEHGYYKRGDKISHYRSIKSECDGQPYSFAYPLPAYGTAVFRFS
ncbi:MULTISPECIES: 1,4-alpha-glucan branching protein GlgB [unclassified Clostridium]|jgi:1,4-alpha-glucan branching enzyme|uniref:1,4-alpha-glucan branching protein GlgB n=1 Tax=Clostridium TaxID=1485 RepID=UPI000E486E2B|nr:MULTISPECIES: 1,4-alpha-glucan branching protein GlgB [unclassified Clostridium]RHO90974.1 1,4-alpha-glucan branching protein GlgB [Clostridium sp. AF37-7]MBD9274081.1 1,4-alpha-glucan branching protein GlgB [Clostridium sp.]RHS69727.1 1,4-alpha-glucan branching protein GlgB [Clostridium sp. AM43-3BH]RHT74508.1 1,4-alpha-glucan branching protein GlgB [Clostridium sp. AM28-20LB]RHT93112.1 1,4-alpha-glucan branching protein GlgB [Clostridium sp. AM27-28]